MPVYWTSLDTGGGPMARRVRDSLLDNREARQRLKVRGKPYWRLIEQGTHLGYRRLKAKAGTWWVRHYLGDQQYETEPLGAADDLSDADGVKILNFWQAQTKARERMAGRATAAANITVAQAVEKYIAERDERESHRAGRPVRSDASQRLSRHVLGQKARGHQEARDAAPLASLDLHKLDDSDLQNWAGGLPKAMKAGTRQRLVNDLKAALNLAYANNRKQLPTTLPMTIRHGLRPKQKDRGANESRVRDNQILTDAQVSGLIRAAQEIDAEEEGWEGDLFRLVLVLAATGTRFSQAARLRVRDCQMASGRLLVPTSRKGHTGQSKTSHTAVPVGRDVLDALRPAVTGVQATRSCWSAGAAGRLAETCGRGPGAAHGQKANWTAPGRSSVSARKCPRLFLTHCAIPQSCAELGPTCRYGWWQHCTIRALR